jgi:protein-serine/threonine kinase
LIPIPNSLFAASLLTQASEGTHEGPSLGRSASVREPPKGFQSNTSALGGLTHQQGKIAQGEQVEVPKTSREAKRRTVQVEYVAPQSQTTRGESSTRNDPSNSPMASRTRARSDSRGAVDQSTSLAASQNKPLPSEPPVQSRGAYAKTNHELSPAGGLPRSMSESAGGALSQSQNPRPNTGHSMGSINAGRLPSRGSYGQPVAPTVAATNAQGRLAQPKNGKQYSISSPISQDSSMSIGRPSTQQLPAKFNATPVQEPPKGHKRSSTVSSIGEKIFGRSGSFFGKSSNQAPSRPRSSKRYPPTSMREPYSTDESRASTDSRRSISYGTNRNNGSEGRSRRFSLINSLKGLSSGRGDQQSGGDPHDQDHSRPPTGPTGSYNRAPYVSHGSSDRVEQPEELGYEAQIDRQFAELHGSQQEFQTDAHSHQPVQYGSTQNDLQQYPTGYGYPQQEGYNGGYDDQARPSMQASRPRGSVLQKNNRKFADAYEYERDASHHSGSSGAARKVMDFFRRRGKARAGDDR